MTTALKRCVGAACGLVSIAACFEQALPVESIAFSEADSAGIPIVTITGSATALPEWKLSEMPIAEVGENADPPLASVGQVAFLGEDRILIYDRLTRELRSFAYDGGLLQRLGGPGAGPGEFRALVSLTVSMGDTVYAFDSRQHRISVFDPNGTLVNTIPVRREFAGRGTAVRGAIAISSTRFVLHGEGPVDSLAVNRTQSVVRDAVVSVVREGGTEWVPPVSSPGAFRVRDPSMNIGSPFSNRPFVAVSGGRIVHGSGLTYDLILRDYDLQPLLVVRWPGFEEPITDAMLEGLREPMSASIWELRAVAPEAADRVIETVFDPRFVPEALPAVGSVLLDDAGRIWVARFRPSEDLRFAIGGSYEQWRQEDVWHVLSADGLPVARLSLPSRTRLLAVRGDRAAVVTRDDLDVERVRILQIMEIAGPPS